jgi:glycosyltransferase 2 family protein
VRKYQAALLRAISIVAVVACLIIFARKMNWSELGADLAHARVLPLVIAGVINYGLLLGKAVAWRIMLAPRHVVSTSRLMRYTIVAFAASVVAPARAGELLRVLLLKRRDNVPTADVAGVAIAEKLLDGVTMLILVAPLPWLLPDLPRWVATSIAICAAIAIAAFVVLSILVRRIRIVSDSSWLARFVAGMHVLRSGRRLAGVMAALFGVWLIDWIMIWLVGYAVGLSLTVPQGLLILFTLNLAITAPSTPAGVGALEVGVLLATRLLGIPDEPAAALALLYHGLQILPLLVVGLVLEWRLVLGKDATLALEPDKVAAP